MLVAFLHNDIDYFPFLIQSGISFFVLIFHEMVVIGALIYLLPAILGGRFHLVRYANQRIVCDNSDSIPGSLVARSC